MEREYLIEWEKGGNIYQKWAIGKEEAAAKIAEVEAAKGHVIRVDLLKIPELTPGEIILGLRIPANKR